MIRTWVGVALLGGLALCGAAPTVRAGEASTATVIPIAGLKRPVQILVDRWGVAHIYAASLDDVFLAQGFNAARDRLFQIDLWRRRGLGRLSAVLGPAFVEQDQATRQFLYRGDMQKEWQAYGKDAQRIARSFVSGINAYIDLVRAEPSRLPFEFRQFGYAPEKWQAEDVVRIRSHALTRNLYSEVARSNVACRADLKSDQVRIRLTPEREVRIPAGTDPCLPPDVLRVFHLATRAVALDSTTAPGARASVGTARETDARDAATESLEGSNAWVIAPSRTLSGRAILANDPHRAYSAPSLRYITHLSAPGLDVIGAGEPALPGISIGHNGTIAFGLTVFSIDQEDLYVYALDPENPKQYRYGGKWEAFAVQVEDIAVRGAAPRRAELLHTRHGPVIYVDKEKHRAFAVRSGWSEPGMAPYFGSVRYLSARNFKQFRAAMRRWGTPAENQVYADVKGNIGWVSGGLAPIRPNWDGLLPVPGDGRYEWAGFLPGELLPSLLNPAQGWFASANEMNLPPDYPVRERKLGFEWPGNDRHLRLSEVLARPGKVSIEDSLQLQNDVLSTPARRMVALLKPLSALDRATRMALQLLNGWNFLVSAESAEAALFEVWWSRFLGPMFKEAVLSRAAAASIAAPDQGLLLDTLERPEAAFGADARVRRDRLLLDSLKLAWVETEKLLGNDPARWQWGRLHYALMAHPFAAALDDVARARLDVGPFAKHGSGSTPNLSAYDPWDFRQIGGPSFRIVVDVGNWDNSRAINAPGQSGDPASPHYRDLAPLWLKGEYFPLLYSRAMIEAAAAQRIELRPLRR